MDAEAELLREQQLFEDDGSPEEEAVPETADPEPDAHATAAPTQEDDGDESDTVWPKKRRAREKAKKAQDEEGLTGPPQRGRGAKGQYVYCITQPALIAAGVAKGYV